MLKKPEVKSPFKVLCPYEQEDTDYFFGRDTVAKELYKFITKNRLVLVYGAPDCGKTSIVQCGLNKIFDISEWVPFYVNRCGNINYSLLQALYESDIIKQNLIPEMVSSEKILEAIALIEKRSLRPVYIIFDQLEETLLLGSDEEIKTFILVLKNIINSSQTQSCHLVFILREEYLALLRPFEKAINGFQDRRFHIETFLEKELFSVVEKTCRYFNIQFSNPEEQIGLILNNISDRSDITLSYLNIYMDQLWRDDYIRTYKGKEVEENKYPELQFTTDEIKALGNIRKIANRFLIEHIDTIQKSVEEKFPESGNETVKNVLDAFVNSEGIRQNISYRWSGEKYNLFDTAPRYLRELPEVLFTYIIQNLQRNSLVRLKVHSMELSNNLIAEIIFHERPIEKRRTDEIAQAIISQYNNYGSTRQYLTSRQIQAYETFLPELNLKDNHIKFFRDSKTRYQRKTFLKITGYIVLPVLIFMLLGGYRLADITYGLYYLDHTVDTINNKIHAVRLAKYIFERGKKDSYEDAMKMSFLKLFQQQEIQGQFSVFNEQLPTTNFNSQDVSISASGNYILITDRYYDSSGSIHYKLYDSTGKVIMNFNTVGYKYAYFIGFSDSILLAYNMNHSMSDSLFPQFNDYPNSFSIFDCRRPEIESQVYNFNDGFLFPKNDIFRKVKSDFDSYKVRYTDSGYLVVPFYVKEKGNTLTMRLRIYNEKVILNEFPLSSTVSISKNGKNIGIGYKSKIPMMYLYSQSGQLSGEISNIFFADYTKSGSVLYIRTGKLVLRSPNGDTSRQYYVSPLIDYAWADGKGERFILTKSRDSVFLINARTPETIHRFKEKLVGWNFEKLFFITYDEGPDTGGKEGRTFIIRKRLFSGNLGASLVLGSAFKNFQYNEKTGDLLILTDSNQLKLLDINLKVKASFQLTANDLYAFCRNGNKFYYLRDNWLSVFNNNESLRDLSNFDSTFKWLTLKEKKGRKKERIDNESELGFSVPLNDLKKKYNLQWPSQRILKVSF